MALTILNNVLRILFLILLQGLIVNRILFLDGLVLPWIYIFGLLMLPFSTPRWLVLLIGFFTGLLMDLFTGLVGLHTSAALFLAYLMPWVQKILSPREGYDALQRPTLQSMGMAWYLTYAGVLALAHHAWLFFLEIFRFSGFFNTLGHILLSTMATLFLMVIGQYLIYKTRGADA